MICLMVVLFGISCKSNSTDKARNDSAMLTTKDTNNTTINENISNIEKEDTLYSLIGTIDEVKKLIKKTNSKSSNQKVSIIISKKPDSGFAYYWMQVGIDDATRFQPVYNFYIDPKSYAMHYYDTANDSIITLVQWRKLRGW